MRAVAPGTYAVRLGALGGDAAYVALIVGAPFATVAKWEVALTSGPSSSRGFVVDDCTAGYLDVAGIPALRREGAPDVLGRLIAAGYAERPHAVVDLGGAGNLVAFGTGTAGRFTSYWGLDRSGAPVVLVTDLGILGADRTEHVDAPRGARILPFRRR
jgi:hypothetical protein